jgi:hypothetical protein
LVEDGTVIERIVAAARFLKERRERGEGGAENAEDAEWIGSVERAARNTLWQEAVIAKGEASPELTAKIKSMIKNRMESYRRLYGAITGEGRFSVEGDYGDGSLSPEEWEKERRRREAAEARRLLKDGGVPSVERVEAMRREGAEERRRLRGEVNKLKGRLAGYEEYIGVLERQSAEAYRAALAARKNMDAGAEAELRKALYREIKERREYLELAARLDAGEKAALARVMELNYELMKSVERERTLEWLGGYIEKGLRMALAPPGRDVKQSYKRVVNDARVVLGNTFNRRFLKRASAEGTVYVEQVFDRYVSDAVYKAGNIAQDSGSKNL